MAANVEIKAHAADIDELERRAADLADGDAESIEQRDTFFRLAGARLKLRVLDGRRAELIWYRRSDDSGPKRSTYRVVPVTNAGELESLLAAALGVRGHVIKRRTVYLAGRTRIHLDRVDGLGEFVELEVVLEPGEATERGEREARGIMQRLGIRDESLVRGAYLDLIEARSGG